MALFMSLLDFNYLYAQPIYFVIWLDTMTDWRTQFAPTAIVRILCYANWLYFGFYVGAICDRQSLRLLRKVIILISFAAQTFGHIFQSL